MPPQDQCAGPKKGHVQVILQTNSSFFYDLSLFRELVSVKVV